MKLLLLATTGAGCLWSQQDPEKIRAAMRDSLDRQKASVVRQAAQSREQKPGFFLIPFPELAAVAAPAAQDCDPLAQGPLSGLIESAAKREQLQPELLHAVIRRESGGRPCAISSKGAQGLMQLMPATVSDLNVSDPFDPEQNVNAGSKYLKQLLLRYAGDLSLALSAYNAGPGRVEGKIPEIAETKEYVRSILSDLKIE